MNIFKQLTLAMKMRKDPDLLQMVSIFTHAHLRHYTFSPEEIVQMNDQMETIFPRYKSYFTQEAFEDFVASICANLVKEAQKRDSSYN